MAASVDVLVIGGGIIGLTAAYELAEAGLKVEVVDRGDFGKEASWAGAGIIPPGNFAKAATPYDKLRAFGSEQFQGYTERLRDLVGIDSGYRKCGGIEWLDVGDGEIVNLWKAEGIEHREVGRGFLLPDMAQVRNPRLLAAIIAACELKKVSLRSHCEVTAFELADHRIDHVRLVSGERFSTSHYLFSSGAWTDSLLAKLGITLGIHPVRGQILQYLMNDSPAHILIHGKRYIVPRGDGTVLVGSTEEPEAGFEKLTTPEGIASLKAFAEEFAPSLRTAKIERSWAGLRPGSRDRMPSIGFMPGFDNALAAVGHFRSGIQLSLGTARMLRELILKEPFTIDPTPFRLDRPPTPLGTLAFRS